MSIQIPDFSTTKILVIGDLMLDRYWHGDTRRISPESPVPVVNVNEVEDRAGGAANVALNLAALGAKVTLAGITGEDVEAQTLQTLLERKGIDCLFEKRANQTTITKLRVISRNQQLIRLDFEKNFALQRPLNLNAFPIDFASYDAVVLSDYNKGTLAEPQSIIHAAKNAGKKVIIDPKGLDFSKYQNASLLTPNQSEFEAIVGSVANDQELLEKGEQLRQSLELDALLITRSEKGMALIEKNKAPYLQPTDAKEISDVTGAGDTVIATLAVTLAATGDSVLASQLANKAAGIVIGKLGTATASRSELELAVQKESLKWKGVVSENDLLALIKVAKDKHEKIVMTNGCFDILHPGHVAYLKEAAALGNKLIVAVNDDLSVKRLKGDSRPINPLEHRMEMLAAIDGVDWVVAFSEDTPERIITKMLPDILVKGGDYKVEEIAGFNAVTNNGGDVKILQFKDGYSTTKIIEKIKYE